MLLPEAATGSAAPGRRRIRDRPGPELHGRRPVAGRGGRSPRRVPDGAARGPAQRRGSEHPRLYRAVAFRCRIVGAQPGRRQRRSPMIPITDLRVKIFADGADLQGMQAMSRKPWIKGFTTNPTLMRKAGVADYRRFALDVVKAIPDRPISFEVFSDEFAEMAHQAVEMAMWRRHVTIKIRIANAR